ncbi:MAG: serine hydrolase [Acidobacteria bacterium]|nr:serine hydrolase [Acidobacteriota bacterium]
MKMHVLRVLYALAIALTIQAGGLFAQTTADIEAKVDKIFEKWTAPGMPGCSVGVSVAGKPVLAKAYGLADLEHDVRNAADTIFEAGSVSKQFTAAGVLLLAREGKLSLDDPVRKYIPELPDYGVPVTIRHMLHHISGLRDWGSVAGIMGWPRTSRVHTHAHVLEIVSKQKSLNFPAGSRYSYSNTGYNLSAILVSRVSGMPFAEFTKKRIFEPLGMTRTSWRDDHTRIVKGRAIAYSEERDGFSINMPFENVHGNGGLLTTVGDLLKWNENFVNPKVGDAAFVAQQQQPGKFNDDRAGGYAFGLQVGNYKGVREVAHSGSTAGYRAHLARYPDQHVSVAVLCNGSSGQATQYTHAVADLYLAGYIKEPVPPAPRHPLTATEVSSASGLYRDKFTGQPLNITSRDGSLRVGNATLVPMSATSFVTANGQRWEISSGAAKMTDQYGSVQDYERVSAAKPTLSDLQQYVGTYVSDDAETVLTVAVEGQNLVVKRRPDTTIRLTPIYPDAFSGLGTVIFRRDASGRPAEFSIVQDRVWNMPFRRQQRSSN